MQWTSTRGRERYLSVLPHAAHALIGLDYDGTLAPLVDDPPHAHVHPDVPALLCDLSAAIRTIALVTGRSAGEAVRLGRLDTIAADCPNLVVLGQYGNETWTALDQVVVSSPPPPGMTEFIHELSPLLRRLDVAPFIEGKTIAVALHTRMLSDPTDAYETLLPEVTDLAHRHGLIVEPGRFVLEARAPGMDKGIALRSLIERHQPDAVIYVGDDLGDLPAFAELESQRTHGLPTLRVCTGAPLEPPLAAEADLVLDGPEEVVSFFRQLLADMFT